MLNVGPSEPQCLVPSGAFYFLCLLIPQRQGPGGLFSLLPGLQPQLCHREPGEPKAVPMSAINSESSNSTIRSGFSRFAVRMKGNNWMQKHLRQASE